jgi:AcrR family transcriptional regulator
VTEGLRERKKAETRRALTSAAVRLAGEHGPDGVTVEQIADAAGVSPRTFFNYFATKEDAIVGISPTQPSELLEDMKRRPANEPPFESLRVAITATAERLRADVGEWSARNRLVQQHPTLAVRRASRFAVVERELVDEVARRTGLDADHDAYPALVVTAALAALRVSLTVWHEGDPREFKGVLADAFAVLERGLAPPQR